MVHGQLRLDQGLQEQLLNLHALEQHLPTNMREEFLNLPMHNPMLGYLSTMNACFVPILDYLICFKSELGLSLQRMIESYNLIIMQQFKNYFNSENAKSREFSEKIKYVDEKIKEVNQQKDEQDYKQELINTLLQSKDKIIAELTMRNEALEEKEEDLQKYIKSTKMNLDEPDARVEQEKQKILDQIAKADVESDALSSDSDLQLAEGKAVGWYDGACNDYQDTEVERTNNLNNMQKIITRLLKKGNVTISTQTDPIEGLELNGGNELASENENVDLHPSGD